MKNQRALRLLSSAMAAAAMLLGMGVLALPSAGQEYDQKLFGEMKWRMIGPFRAGRSIAVTGVRGQPDVYYFGAVGGGVWKTDDAGRTWKPIFDVEPVASIGAIAVAPSNANVIYVGSGEADMRSSISEGNGMYRSTDAGKTWTRIGLEDSRQIGRILVDPNNEERVFVAALGHAYGPNQERGVYRTEDGGKTWQRVLFKDENTGAIDLAFEPGNPKTIYAALWQTRRPPWSIYPASNGPGSGLYRSRDGGDHWEQITGHGLPSEGLGKMGIAIAPSNPRRIYLIVDAKEGGLYRSDDGGENWLRASQDKRIWQRGWYFGEVSVDPMDPETVYVPNTALYRSTNGGKTMTVIKGEPGGDDYHELWIDPDNPQRMVLGSDQGVVVTHNGGATWSSWYNQPTGQFYHVATDQRFPYWVYGAEQDSGAAATASRSNYRGLNFLDWRPMEAGDENGYVAPDPANPGIIYGGFVTKQDLRNEQIVQMPPTLAQSGHFRRTWTLPLVFSPIEKSVLYFGSQMLFRTADGGNSWQPISPDLTREDPGVPGNLDPATAADAPKTPRRGVIYTIAPSPVKAGEIWAGTDDGLIQLTQDEGKTWKNVTPPGISAWSKVTHMEASHFAGGTAYAAVDRHRLEDNKPYLYRTKDFGKTWQQVNRGIPEGSYLNCVREDPKRKGLLYACTETGVYVSFDDGEDWQSLRLNMPTVSVRDLVVHGYDLVIATFGRAFWISDDATPLRQLSEKVASAKAWLFTPETAYRVQPNSDQGTPVPLDEAQARNAPEGATLDYYLKEKATTPVRLEIFDEAGKLVRRFRSDDEVTKTNPNDVPIAMVWVHDQSPLSAEEGMHRFEWDLRYPLAKSVHRSTYGPRGPWAAPGKYMVKLSGDGWSMSAPLVVKMDPRVKTPQAALAQQFSESRRLAENLGKVASALESASKIQKEIEGRKKEASENGNLQKALEGLETKIEMETKADRFADFGLFGLGLPTRKQEPLPAVSGALTRLLMVVESADAAPTADAKKSAASWNAAAGDALAQWELLEKRDLLEVNAALKKAKLRPLTANEPDSKE